MRGRSRWSSASNTHSPLPSDDHLPSGTASPGVDSTAMMQQQMQGAQGPVDMKKLFLSECESLAITAHEWELASVEKRPIGSRYAKPF